jgi:hypothetical protein
MSPITLVAQEDVVGMRMIKPYRSNLEVRNWSFTEAILGFDV